MEPKNPREFDQSVYDLFDKFVHGDIDRRAFIDGAGKFSVAGMTGAMILESLTPRFAEAQVVAKDDKRIVDLGGRVPVAQRQSEDERLSREAGGQEGQAARRPGGPREPRSQPPHRGHRTPRRPRGLHGLRPGRALPARRLPGRRGQGPGALREAGPSEDRPGLPGRGRLAQGPPRTASARLRWWASASAAPSPTCWPRRSRIWRVLFPSTAARRPRKRSRTSSAPCSSITARRTSGWSRPGPRTRRRLKANNVKYEGFVYPGAQHGFNNDTTPRFDKANADLAWKRTVEFFRKNLN